MDFGSFANLAVRSVKTTRKWREAAIFWSFSRLIRRNMVWKRFASTPYFFESGFFGRKQEKAKLEETLTLFPKAKQGEGGAA